MAKFSKPHHMRGTIDGITYYTYRGIPCARKKSSLNGARMKTDPAFIPTNEAGGKFGKGSTLSKDFRRSIAPFDHHFSDGQLHSRLTALFAQLIRSNSQWFNAPSPDFVGMQPILKQFEFYADEYFSNIVRVECDAYHNLERDDLRIEIEAPRGSVFRNAPSSTLVRLHFVLAPLRSWSTVPEIDTDEDMAKSATWTSKWMPANETFRLVEIVPIPKFLRQGHPLAMLLAIEPGFMSTPSPLSARKGRAMRIIGILPA